MTFLHYGDLQNAFLSILSNFTEITQWKMTLWWFYAVTWGNCWPLIWSFNTFLGKIYAAMDSSHRSLYVLAITCLIARKSCCQCPEAKNLKKTYLSQTISNCSCAHKHVSATFPPNRTFLHYGDLQNAFLSILSNFTQITQWKMTSQTIFKCPCRLPISMFLQNSDQTDFSSRCYDLQNAFLSNFFD